MADRAEVVAELKDLVERILSAFSRTLKSTNDDDLEKLFTDESKMTVEKRVLGGKDIVRLLRRLNCEFTAEKYTYILTAEDQVIVNGFCVWGNSSTAFSMDLNLDIAKKHVEVANFRIFPAKP